MNDEAIDFWVPFVHFSKLANNCGRDDHQSFFERVDKQQIVGKYDQAMKEDMYKVSIELQTLVISHA